MAIICGSGGEKKLADCPTVCPRARQATARISSVFSFLIYRSLDSSKNYNQYLMAIGFSNIPKK
jgi:hypothetical protein